MSLVVILHAVSHYFHVALFEFEFMAFDFGERLSFVCQERSSCFRSRISTLSKARVRSWAFVWSALGDFLDVSGFK